MRRDIESHVCSLEGAADLYFILRGIEDRRASYSKKSTGHALPT